MFFKCSQNLADANIQEKLVRCPADLAVVEVVEVNLAPGAGKRSPKGRFVNIEGTSALFGCC